MAKTYARQLTAAGVEVTLTRYPGAIHGFVSLNALANTPASRAAVTQITHRSRNGTQLAK